MGQKFSDIPLRLNDDITVDAGWFNILRLAGINLDSFTSGSEENTQTGSNITLNLPTKVMVILTGAVASIANIAPPSSGTQFLILVNRKGSDVILVNGDTNPGDISTSTGANLTVKDKQALLIAFDPNTSGRWRVLGGAGGGSSQVGSQDLTLGQQSVTISLPTAMPNANYKVFPVLETSDADPAFINCLVIHNTKTTTQFTVKLSAPVDTGNFKLGWLASLTT